MITNSIASLDAGQESNLHERLLKRSAELKTLPIPANSGVRMTSCAIVILTVLAGSGASAQSVNLTGSYRCVQGCRAGLAGYLAHVTQNGSDLNLVDEAGEPSRAWPDWFAPATRIWIDRLNEGAIYSSDGMFIQFDSGRIWQRDFGPPPLPPRAR